MSIDSYPREHGLHLALAVNNVSRAHNPHALLAVQCFFLPSAISLESLVFGITDKRKIQLVFISELGQLVRGVSAHAHNFSPKLIQFLLAVTKLVSLPRSTRSVGFWKEIEDQHTAFEIAQLRELAGIRRQGKTRRFISNIEHIQLLRWPNS